MYDGNFSAEQFKPKVQADDVRLADGAGFMVADDRYRSHLKVAKNSKQVCILCRVPLLNLLNAH